MKALNTFITDLSRFLLRLIASSIVLAFVLFVLLPNGLRLFSKVYYGLNIGQIEMAADQIRFSNVYTDDQLISLPSVIVHFKFRHLITGEIDALEVKHGKLTVLLEEGGQEEFDPKSLQDILEKPPVVINHILVEDLTVDIKGSRLEAFKMEPFQAKVDLTGVLSHKEESVFNADISLGKQKYFQAGSVEANFHWPKVEGTLGLKKVRGIEIPLNFDVFADFELVYGQGVQVKGEIEERGEALISFDAKLDPQRNGSVDFEVLGRPIDSSHYPLKLFGIDSPRELKSYSAYIDGQGRVSLKGEEIETTGQISFSNGKLSYGIFEVEGIQADLDLSKLKLRPELELINQEVTIESLKGPVAEAYDIRFSLSANDNQVRINSYTGVLWGGNFKFSPFVMWPLPEEQKIKMKLKDISLEEMSAQTQIPGLNVKGIADGVLPIRLYNDGSFAIEESSIKTKRAGILSYEWSLALASEDDNLRLVGKALQNFNYDLINVYVSKDRYKKVTVKLNLFGKNPDLLKGRAFNLTFNISGDILEALEGTISAFTGNISFLLGMDEGENKEENK